ncbi:MAG: MFS transporter, partial [Burkholderiaceae bacterium]
LMGCMGAGAVGAGLVIGRLRARLGLEVLIRVGCLTFAAATIAAAFVPWPTVIYLALMLAGASWMSVMSTFNTATQTSAPPWVRARAAALHVLCALGSFALGSALWGALSGLFGLSVALTLAGVAMASGVLLGRWFPLRMGQESDVTQVIPMWEDLTIAHEPSPQDGPVAVEIAYRIREDDVPAFLAAASQLRAPRRRDGATFWRLYRDLADPARYVEWFIVTSWADYLHQRSRATLSDQDLDDRVRAFLIPGETVTMQHYVAER